jgi:hypothetical protein
VRLWAQVAALIVFWAREVSGWLLSRWLVGETRAVILDIRYVRLGGVSIAYQVFGDGPGS